MKIIRVIARLNVGGPARHVIWLTREMVAAGHDALLVVGSVPPGESDMAYFAARHGVQPIVVPQMSRELSVRDLGVIWKLLRLFWRERPDVIHTHTAKAGAVGRAAGLLYRLAVRLPFMRGRARPLIVHTYHGHVFHSYYGRFRTTVFLTIERVLARLATDRIIVVSPQQLREIRDTYRVGRQEQFAVVPLGLDLTAFRACDALRGPARAALGIRDDELTIGIFGRLTEIKNHRLFMQAAATLSRRRGSGSRPTVRFVIVGDGPLRPALEEQARQLGIQDRVLFLGDRQDVEALYAAVDIVALSSLNEGTPLTLIEAMASARPIASTAVGGVADLVGRVVVSSPAAADGISVHSHGVLVHRSDADTLAAAFRYLLDRPEERLAMGRRGQDFVKSSYGLDRLTEELNRAYGELIPSKAGASPGAPLDRLSTSTYTHLGEGA